MLSPFFASAQDTTVVEGVPSALSRSTLIILKHENIEVEANEEDEKTKEYVIHRQENHNRVTKEFNAELARNAKENYPFKYVLAYPSELPSILVNENTYVLYSNVYQYNFLKSQPAEGELIVFPYYLSNQKGDTIFKLFELDEMKVYDSKLIMKKLNKKMKAQFPEAY